MKRFICASPYQKEGGLHPSVYQPIGNDKLTLEDPVCFPVVVLLAAYAEKGETVELVTIVADYPAAKENYKILCKQVEEQEKKRGFVCNKIQISVPYREDVETHLLTFQKLIDQVKDEDRLYCCLTYGSKPTPIIEMMAINYACRIKKNCMLDCVVYGQFDHHLEHPSSIYDVTALVIMDEVVRIVADMNVKNPQDAIRRMLGL